MGTEDDPIGDSIPQQAKVISIRSDETIHRAATAMHQHGVGATVVVNPAGKLIGILTERDVLGLIALGWVDIDHTAVETVMTRDPATCRRDTAVRDAREVMIARQIRHLPVVDDEGVAIGMFSSRDALAHQVASDRAMRGAAEQVAMLTTCLKSLNFDEVVSLVTEQVPSVFQAKRSVLFFPPADRADGECLLVRRNSCPCPDGTLESREDVSKALETRDAASRSVPEPCGRFGAESPCLIVPLSVAGMDGKRDGSGRSSPGYLCMCSVRQEAHAAPQLLRYKGALLQSILNAALSNARLYQLARQESLTDTLTGIGSRRMFEEQLEVEFTRSKRYGRPFCVAVFDVDHFKAVNDTLGHVKGDEALRKFCGCLRREKRTTDVVARYGGDEFALLLPETDERGALELLERIHRRIRSIPMPGGLTLSASCGLVELGADSTALPNQLVRLADVALYEAKKAGRDQLQTWSQVSARAERDKRVDEERINELQDRIAHMSVRSKEIFLQSIWGLAQALEARDTYTRCHSENVMRYSVAIAETMELDSATVDVVRRAAMIHDIGKIGVPDSILHKPDKLTDEERAVIEEHPLIAIRILDQMQFLQREIPIIRHHHEWYNGEGYPDGISGSSIPLGARILAVADAFDAITSNRIYRESRPAAAALEILIADSGSQFDPGCVEAMRQWIKRVGEALGTDGVPDASELLHSQKSCIVAA